MKPKFAETHVSAFYEGKAPMNQLLLALLQRDRIPALTLTEPWATAVAIGDKKNETRSWETSYQGPLAIHSAKSFPREAQELCEMDPFCSTLSHAGHTPNRAKSTNQWELPLGYVLAFVWLDHVSRLPALVTEHHLPPEPERSFGNYSPGRYIWHFSAVYRLKVPIATRGSLGLWQWQPTDSCWLELQTAFDQEIRKTNWITPERECEPNNRKAS